MRQGRRFVPWVPLAALVAFWPLAAASQGTEWSLRQIVTGKASTLRISVSSANPQSGAVTISGNDTAQPAAPFTFTWGDGQSTDGFFSQAHTYQDRSRNYTLTVTAHCDDGTTDEAGTPIFFVRPELDPQAMPQSLAVTIPDHLVPLASRISGMPPPSGLAAFDDSFFAVMPRSDAEYLLTAAASVEEDLSNGDHDWVDGAFQQVLLWDPAHGGAQAFSWTDPLAVGSADYELLGSVRWSVLFHELAHNFHLNSPAGFSLISNRVGSRGGSVAFESVARILQAATAYELLNKSEKYGLGQEISANISASTIDMAKEFRGNYERYRSSGMHFCAWNDPNTSTDEVSDTYCTLATKFYMHAEDQDLGYRVPAKRMMRLLDTFDQEDLAKFDSSHDTPAGSAFRSTYMVAALSFAFREDLRREFRDLNFPVTDADYEALWQKADTDPADFDLTVSPSSLTVPRGQTGTFTIAIDPLNGFSHAVDLRWLLPVQVPGVTLELSDETVEPPGTATLTVSADSTAQPASLSPFLRATGEFTAHGTNLPVTVISAPIIDSASFDGKKTLTIHGSGFGSGARVLVNTVDRSAKISSAADTTIVLSGKKKKLGLHAGGNTLVVVDSAGTRSVEFLLNL